MSYEATKAFAREPLGQKLDSRGNFVRSTPAFKFQDERMLMAIPKGEQFEGVMQYFDAIGLRIPENRNTRDFFIPVENMPVALVPIRSADIPNAVLSDISKAKAGIAGSDIIWEKSYELGTDKNEGEEIPLEDLAQNPPKSTLYFGATEEYCQHVEDSTDETMQIRHMKSRTIVTIYPNITRQYLDSNGLTEAIVFKVSGQDEAVQYLYPFDGILGIKSSGRTLEANKIRVLDEFYEVAVRLITFGTDKLSTRDLQILNDLREMTYLALQKRGLI